MHCPSIMSLPSTHFPDLISLLLSCVRPKDPPSTRAAIPEPQLNRPKSTTNNPTNTHRDEIAAVRFPPGGSRDLKIEEVQISDLHDEDVIIAVMGPTGSGKSTFISHVTGYHDLVGHSLHSFTNEIRAVRISLPNVLNVVLVDTPGFDDTHKSDLHILKQISRWLEQSYSEKELSLSGLLYFHRISDNRMAGSALKNLQVFKKLCGSDNYSKVFLVTTMWEEVDNETGTQRIHELRQQYWKEILEGGAEIRYLKNTAESARAVLNGVLARELNNRGIRIQHELTVLHKQLPDTDAGRQLRGHIETLVQRQQDLISRIAREMALAKDPEVIASLKEEFQQLRQTREEAIAQMAELKNSSMTMQLRNIWMFVGDKLPSNKRKRSSNHARRRRPKMTTRLRLRVPVRMRRLRMMGRTRRGYTSGQMPLNEKESSSNARRRNSFNKYAGRGRKRIAQMTGLKGSSGR